MPDVVPSTSYVCTKSLIFTHLGFDTVSTAMLLTRKLSNLPEIIQLGTGGFRDVCL